MASLLSGHPNTVPSHLPRAPARRAQPTKRTAVPAASLLGKAAGARSLPQSCFLVYAVEAVRVMPSVFMYVHTHVILHVHINRWMYGWKDVCK